MIDISTISTNELKDLLDSIPKELKRRGKAEKSAVLEQMKAQAKAAGYSLEELLGETTKEPKQKRTVAVKYRHPVNSALTWTGRGRSPKWVAEWLSSGKKIEQLAV